MSLLKLLFDAWPAGAILRTSWAAAGRFLLCPRRSAPLSALDGHILRDLGYDRSLLAMAETFQPLGPIISWRSEGSSGDLKHARKSEIQEAKADVAAAADSVTARFIKTSAASDLTPTTWEVMPLDNITIAIINSDRYAVAAYGGIVYHYQHMRIEP